MGAAACSPQRLSLPSLPTTRARVLKIQRFRCHGVSRPVAARLSAAPYLTLGQTVDIQCALVSSVPCNQTSPPSTSIPSSLCMNSPCHDQQPTYALTAIEAPYIMVHWGWGSCDSRGITHRVFCHPYGKHRHAHEHAIGHIGSITAAQLAGHK